MKADFTPEEKTLLKGHLSAIARKYGCSHTTVQDLVAGNYEINTTLRRDILKALKDTVAFFQPIAE